MSDNSFESVYFEPKLEIVTMGSGQESVAEAAIERCKQNGSWIFLQVNKFYDANRPKIRY